MTQRTPQPRSTDRQAGVAPPPVSSVLSSGPPMSVSGTGEDGNVTITGTTTLTRDMLYNNLTIDSGGVLQPAGYAIHVRRVLINNGIIRANGVDADGTGEGGAALATNHYGGSGRGAGSGNDAGVANPGKGGGGGEPGTGSAGDHRAAGGVTVPNAAQGTFNVPPNTVNLYDKSTNEILGGGGGGYGDSMSPDGKSGGGGGSGGGVVAIFATVFINNGVVEAKGGDGAQGGNAGTGTGSGGGGGGGGWIVLAFRLKKGSGSLNISGGAAGAAGTTGSPGNVGSSGNTLEMQL